MSEEQLKAFLEKVKVDASLQEQLNAAADVDAVLAGRGGFSISSDDLKNAQAEVSDKELEGAAGGQLICVSILLRQGIWIEYGINYGKNSFLFNQYLLAENTLRPSFCLSSESTSQPLQTGFLIASSTPKDHQSAFNTLHHCPQLAGFLFRCRHRCRLLL